MTQNQTAFWSISRIGASYIFCFYMLYVFFETLREKFLQRELQADDSTFITFVFLGGVWGSGWLVGCWGSMRMKDDSRISETQSLKHKEEAMGYKEEADERLAAVKKMQQEADNKLDMANRQKEMNALRFANDDLQMVKAMRDLPIEDVIDAALVLPIVFKNGQKETEEGYRERRKRLVFHRARKWKEAIRFGNPLLEIVRRQYGLCGDVDRDETGKGCGSCLYCLPVTAVHLDYIKPQSLGGSGEPDNMQALCSSCNVKSGAKFHLIRNKELSEE